MEHAPTCTADKHAALKTFLAENPDERCVLSTREIARRTSLDRRFVGRHRSKYTPRRLADKPKTGAKGYRFKAPRGRKVTEEQRHAIEVGELQRQLADALRKLVAETERADAAEKDHGKTSRLYQRLQSTHRSRGAQSRDFGVVMALARKLAWHGWDHTAALEVMEHGQLLSHETLVDLSPAERALFHELWTEQESKVENQYIKAWGRRGHGKLAAAEAVALDLSRAQYRDHDTPDRLKQSEADRWVHFRRDGWVLRQIEAHPHPIGAYVPFDAWAIAELEPDEVPEGVAIRYVGAGDEIVPDEIAKAMDDGVVVVMRDGRAWLVDSVPLNS